MMILDLVQMMMKVDHYLMMMRQGLLLFHQPEVLHHHLCHHQLRPPGVGDLLAAEQEPPEPLEQ